MIRIGTTRESRNALPRAETTHPEFYRHLRSPWLDRCIARHYDIEAATAPAEGQVAGFSDLAVSRHALISGTTGAGKSRLYLLMAGQLLRQGCSMVAVDLKEETLLHLVELARQAGVFPENITAFLPRQGGIPGWNMLAGAKAGEAAEEFADTVWAANERGPQMSEALAYALIPITAHGLAVPELVQLLRSGDYRNRILSLPDPPGMRDALDLAREYFQYDYANAFSTAVTNKFSAVMRNEYLRRVASAQTNSVDFDRLWDKGKDNQRLIVVHLDKKNLGAEAMRFLGGTVAWRTYRAAIRSGGENKRPVVLGLDEIGLAEGYLSGALSEILAIARGKNLRLIASAQYVGQLPPRVQNDLMKLTHARAYLRIEPDDAAVVAQSLAPGKQTPVPRRVTVEPVKPPKGQLEPVLDSAYFALHDAAEMPLALLDPETWDAFRDKLGKAASRDTRKAAVSLLASLGGLRTDRIYVRDTVRQQWTEVFNMVSRLRDGDWYFDGPRPMFLVVMYPRPRFRDSAGKEDPVSRWTRTLAKLKDQEAVIEDKTNGDQAVVNVDYVPDAVPPVWFMSKVLAKGNSIESADAAYRQRREAMEMQEAAQKTEKQAAARRMAPRQKPKAEPKEPKDTEPNERGHF